MLGGAQLFVHDQHKPFQTMSTWWQSYRLPTICEEFGSVRGPSVSSDLAKVIYSQLMMHCTELLELQATLQSAFQQCTDLSDDPQRGITAFRPHLSLGQWRTPAAARAVKQVRVPINCR